MSAAKNRWIALIGAVLVVGSLWIGYLSDQRRRHAEPAEAALAEKMAGVREAIRRTRELIAAGDRATAAQRSAQQLSAERARPTKPHPDFGGYFASHPELFASYQKALRGKLNQTYGRLFDRLGLTPAQTDRLISLMVRDDENEMDLAMTAQALDLAKSDPSAREFRQEETSEFHAAEQSILGPQDYNALQDFDRAQGMRDPADDVASLVAATGNPMTGDQTDQLTQLMASANSKYQSGDWPDLESTDWNQVLTRAPDFLSASQLAALQAKVQQLRVAAMLSRFYAAPQNSK